MPIKHGRFSWRNDGRLVAHFQTLGGFPPGVAWELQEGEAVGKLWWSKEAFPPSTWFLLQVQDKTVPTLIQKHWDAVLNVNQSSSRQKRVSYFTLFWAQALALRSFWICFFSLHVTDSAWIWGLHGAAFTDRLLEVSLTPCCDIRSRIMLVFKGSAALFPRWSPAFRPCLNRNWNTLFMSLNNKTTKSEENMDWESWHSASSAPIYYGCGAHAK